MIEDKKKIVFIVNPKAGITPKSKVVIELLAGNIIPSSRLIHEVVFTERAGHATEIAREAIKNGADIVVASGGDGTVNDCNPRRIAVPRSNQTHSRNDPPRRSAER